MTFCVHRQGFTPVRSVPHTHHAKVGLLFQLTELRCSRQKSPVSSPRGSDFSCQMRLDNLCCSPQGHFETKCHRREVWRGIRLRHKCRIKRRLLFPCSEVPRGRWGCQTQACVCIYGAQMSSVSFWYCLEGHPGTYGARRIVKVSSSSLPGPHNSSEMPLVGHLALDGSLFKLPHFLGNDYRQMRFTYIPIIRWKDTQRENQTHGRQGTVEHSRDTSSLPGHPPIPAPGCSVKITSCGE